MGEKAVGLARDGRTRNWLFVVYPESAPDNWESKFDELQISWARSPLHDRDLNPTGEIKKAHYHCMLCFDSVKSQDQVKSILSDILGIGAVLPLPCHSCRGAVRYFSHMDNPEKVQYDIKDARFHGIDYESLCAPTSSEKDAIIKEMCDFCRDNDIVELSDLADFCMDNEPDWFHILSQYSTLFMTNYLRSRRHKNLDAL